MVIFRLVSVNHLKIDLLLFIINLREKNSHRTHHKVLYPR